MKMKQFVVVLSAASLGAFGVACSDDDDNNDNPVENIEEDIDLDPGDGTGLPADDS